MNKFNKTNARLVNAYLNLKKINSLNKISVISLCKMSNISKTTFYSHFSDINDFISYVDNYFIDICFHNFDKQYLLFSNANLFFKTIDNLLYEYNDVFSILECGRKEDLRLNVIKKIISLYNEYTNNEEIELYIVFIVGGYLLCANSIFNESIMLNPSSIKKINKITYSVFNNIFINK